MTNRRFLDALKSDWTNDETEEKLGRLYLAAARVTELEFNLSKELACGKSYDIERNIKASNDRVS